MKLSSARLDTQGGRVDNANFKKYGESTGFVVANGSYTVDLSTGNTFSIILMADCTIGFSNPPSLGTQTAPVSIIIKQGGTGGHTVTWPSSVLWGSSTAPILSTVPGASDVVTLLTVDAGLSYYGFFSGSFQPTQTLWVWGQGTSGKLGLFNALSRSSPTQVGTLATWVHASMSNSTTAVRTNGSLMSWGIEQQGQLGLQDTLLRSSPTQVGAMQNWLQVSSSSLSMAIKTGGTLWGWGNNTFGTLVTGDRLHRSSPVQIGALSTWGQVSTSDGSVLARQTDGTLWAWGQGAFGILGQGTNVLNRSSPTQIGTLATWTQVSQGQNSSGAPAMFAVRSDATLWSWGGNSDGALGLRNTLARSSPVQVGTLGTWATISAGGNGHALAIMTDGTLWGWGNNANGQLGSGATLSRSSPAQIGTLSGWSQISAMATHSAAMRTDGTLWTWGDNSSGQLGQLSTSSSSSPVQVGTLAVWANLAQGAGGYHTVVLRNN